MSYKHGHYCFGKPTPTYISWCAMLKRSSARHVCNNEKAIRNYRDKGIDVCDRWQVFENFLEDMGIRPEGKYLDRIDNLKGYSPENCRWATAREQARNVSYNRMLTYNGETKCLADWADSIGMKRSTLFNRLKRMSLVDAIETPIDEEQRRRSKGNAAAPPKGSDTPTTGKASTSPVPAQTTYCGWYVFAA